MLILIAVIFLLLMEIYRLLVSEGITLGITNYSLAFALAMGIAVVAVLLWSRR